MAEGLQLKRWLFEAAIATGSLGAGTTFAINGNDPLRQGDVRGGCYLNRQHAATLQRVCHYLKALLGERFQVLPIGYVGEDAAGRGIVEALREAEVRDKYVGQLADAATLEIVEVLFPDGSRGELVDERSASSRVTAECVHAAEADFANFAEDCIALALTGVPLEAREAVLELATKYHCFRVASFTREEIGEAMNGGLLLQTDMLFIGLPAAIALFGGDPSGKNGHELAKAAIWKLRHINRKMYVTINGGRLGSWIWDGKELLYECAWSVQPVNSVGGDDAFLAGLLCALTGNLTLDKALNFGNLVAACATQSPHALHRELNRDRLADLATSATRELDMDIWQLLGG